MSGARDDNIIGRFFIKKTPKKAQNSEKAHWHDHSTHVDGPSGDSGMSEELEGF